MIQDMCANIITHYCWLSFSSVFFLSADIVSVTIAVTLFYNYQYQIQATFLKEILAYLICTNVKSYLVICTIEGGHNTMCNIAFTFFIV